MSDEAFEKWYSNATATWRQYIDPKEHARLAWSESRRQRDADWKRALGAGFPDYKPELDDIGTLVLAHDVEVEKQVETRVKAESSEPQTAETCQQTPPHPRACLTKEQYDYGDDTIDSGTGRPPTVSVWKCLACSAAREAAERAARLTLDACSLEARQTRTGIGAAEAMDDLDLQPLVERAARGER